MRLASPTLLPMLLALFTGCEDGPSPKQKAELERRTEQVQSFEQRLAVMARSVPREPSACPDGTIRMTIARTQNRRVLFADTRSLKASAQGALNRETSPLTFLVSSALLKRPGSAQVVDQKTATDAQFAILSLKKNYDFLAALDFRFKAPKAEHKRFHAGELRGRLALFAIEGGKALCSEPVSAESSLEAVKKPGQSPQEAADQDFELQVRRALEQVFSQMTGELVLDLG